MSFSEYVTIRATQSKTKKINKSDLCLDEMNESTSEEFHSDSSFPNLSVLENTMLLDFKNHIQNLKLQLQIAHNEVDKLNEENHILKKKLDTKETEIKILKSAGLSELSIKNSSTPTAKQKRCVLTQCTPIKSLNSINLNKKNIINGKTSLTLDEKPTTEEQISTLRNKSYKPSINKPEDNPSSKGPNILKQTPEGVHINDTSNIFIIGDEKIRGLSTHLLNSRKYKSDNIYKISAMIKPNATCSEIFSYSESILKGGLSQDDRVILSFGASDKNPFEVIKELSVILHKLRNIQVFITPVIYNSFINVNLLNDYIYSIAKTHNNCYFMSPQTENIVFPSVYRNGYLQTLTYVINKWIDTEDYKKNYIHNIMSTRKKYFKMIMDRTSSGSSYKNLCRKGTIPYYFRYENKSSSTIKQNSVSNNTLNSLPKKGTIPFYFRSVNVSSKTFFRSSL